MKTFKERPQEICPWVDDEILGKRKARDHFYFKFHNSNTPFSCSDDYKKYQLLRTECQSLERKKMKDYFSSKKISDFKNNKLYWEFYSSSIKVKTCKTDNITSNYFLHEEREYTDPEEIGNVFNSFFTNLSSTSLSSESDCDSYIDKTFSRLKRENKIKLKSGSFKFVRTNENIVERLIMNLNSASGPVIYDIPSKVIKSACITLVQI